jgi:hypothetical protein
VKTKPNLKSNHIILMTFSPEMLTMLDYALFNKTTGIDPIARTPSRQFLAYTGLDDPALIYDMPSTEFNISKLRTLATTPEFIALLAAVEATSGQLGKMSGFLRKLNAGTTNRFLIDHDPSNTEHLKSWCHGGASALHGFEKDWESYKFDEKLARKLILSNAASFRDLIAYIRTHFTGFSYLMEAKPQDNFTSIGKKKDKNLLDLMTLVLTSSNFGSTFKIGQNPNQTGYDLFLKAKTYFLNASDSLAEIQEIQAKFAALKMQDCQGVAGIIEKATSYVISLEDLGVTITPIEVYTKLRIEIAEGSSYLGQLCITFRVLNTAADDDTLPKFLAMLTNDPKAMAYRNPQKTNPSPNPKTILNLDEHPKSWKKDKDKEKTKLRKKVYQANRRAAEVALNALLSSSTTNSRGNSSLEGLDNRAINLVKQLRKKWDEETYGIHSNLNKVFNDHVDDKGNVDYSGFIKTIERESKFPSKTVTSRNSNVGHANALLALCAEEPDVETFYRLEAECSGI